MESRARVWWPGAGLALCGMLIGLMAMEAVARQVWTAPWCERLVEAQTGRLHLKDPARNRWGLRDRDYPAIRAPGTQRLLILGDSFTFGSDVERPFVFPELIERALGEDPPRSAPAGVEVLNGGLPGSLTDSWLALWNQVADEFDPDAVLVVFFLRDGTTVTSQGFFQSVRSEIAARNQASGLYRLSYLYRLLLDRLDRRRISRDFVERFETEYFGHDGDTAEWQRAQRNLRELRASAEARGARFGFAVFPVLVDLDDDYPFQRYEDLVVGFGREQGFRTHDMLPDFRGENAPDLWVGPANQHPNPRGHAIAARSLLPLVRELLEKG